jgi:pectate lyase
MYSYTPDSPEDAKTKVMQYSGRMQGGDFEWTFNQPGDDTSYAVNQPLKTALSNYTTTLVYVQGETPPSTQTLSSTNNTSQTVVEGTPIEAIVFTWGGDATDATVTGLPASGITFVKDATAKTITITGTPTATVSYTIATSGATGTPVTDSGTITLGTTTAGDEIHNFTTSGKTSTFYAITGNLSTSKGTANYNGLVLTQCLKMESTTNISFTTAQQGVLTLVLNDNYTGDLKINGTTYNAVAGIITLPIAAGNYAITKGSVSTTNLYYMKVAYDTAGVHNVKDVQVKLYPNPVFNTLQLTSMLNVEKVEIYTILGVKVLTVKGTTESIDMGHLSRGSYVVKMFTNKGTLDKIIIKK